MTYEISLATDKILSIYFIVYSYGVGAAHSVQDSFTVNYDLESEKVLRLADIFKPNANYLRLISQYCLNELTKQDNFVFKEALTPKAKNYESWNITKEGLQINFAACSVLACSAGEQEVTIPFVTMRDVLRTKSAVISLTQ